LYQPQAFSAVQRAGRSVSAFTPNIRHASNATPVETATSGLLGKAGELRYGSGTGAQHPRLSREIFMKPQALPILLCALVTTALTAGEEPATKVVEEAITTERTDLEVLVEVEGTLHVARQQKLKLVPEEFPGPYNVSEITPSGQRVKADAILVHLNTAPLDRVIRGAQEALDAAKLKIQTTGEELANLKEANGIKSERMALDLRQKMSRSPTYSIPPISLCNPAMQ